jgi:hypothetical protein
LNLRASSTFRAGDFARLESKLVPKLVAGVTNATAAVLDISLQMVPYDTGELAASGGTSTEWKGRKVVGYVSYTSGHAAYNEFGTGRRGAESGHGAPGIEYKMSWPGMPGHPYLRPALDIGRQQTVDAIRAALQV